MSYSQIGLELVKVVITGLVAAVLVHLLEHRRFIQGRWWDRKADAYGSIVGSLASMEYSLRSWLEAVERLRRFGVVYLEDEQKRVDGAGKEFVEARIRLERVVAEGNYIISRKVAGILSELMEKFPRYRGDVPSDLSEVVDLLRTLSEATGSCLEIVRAEAQSELSVKWYSWF